jgi:hypothetical protein
LRDEALYYASCANYKEHFSDPSHPVPLLPRLPYTEWVQQGDQTSDQKSDQKLIDKIKQDMLKARLEPVERNEMLLLLERMCATGWAAFGCHQLKKMLPPQERQQLIRFTGDVIIGIVKPFFEEGSSTTSLERQTQTMILMRHFGWRMREFQDRNWVDGYLVDGGDIDIRPLHFSYIERSWSTAFFQSIKQKKT